jgi:hypothetical protein
MLLIAMNELDQVWDEMLAAAAQARPEAQPAVVADYLELKNANDRVRDTAVGWLFATAREIAEHANRKNAQIAIEEKDGHRFPYRSAELSGPRLVFRRGVRALTLEAGWTRAPGDGFMRAGALAVARISHFGLSKANAELHLLKFEDRPQWFAVPDEQRRISFELEDLIGHFKIFLDG